jgi:hypothetical protein
MKGSRFSLVVNWILHKILYEKYANINSVTDGEILFGYYKDDEVLALSKEIQKLPTDRFQSFPTTAWNLMERVTLHIY